MEGQETSSPGTRLQIVAAAVAEWKRQLVDLSGRNQLLYYRDLKVGTLRLDEAEPAIVKSLIEGKEVRLSRLFPATAVESEGLDDTLKSARTLWKKAQENLEERGIETLFLAVGMATWESATSASTPNSPLFVNPLSLEPVGAGRSDFSLKLAGEWELNATLQQLLNEEFGSRSDTDPFVAGFEESGFSLEAVASRFVEGNPTVPGLRVKPEVVVGNFAYTKLPMVRDIEESVEFLAENDLIAAIAGDAAAQRAVFDQQGEPTDPTRPDHTPPKDEFLILDADSSQSRVVNAIVDGHSAVIQGPPGTGKSQTIANLIATLSARGKRVLFVAEKRAAIEAVVKRLNSAGLGHLVMDLHGGISSKRAVAEQLGASLSAVRATPLQDFTELHHILESSRAHLRAYDEALHRRWEPWDVSMWEVQVRLLGIAGSLDFGIRFDRPTLDGLISAVRIDVIDTLREWAERTVDFRQNKTPWTGTLIRTNEDVDTVSAIVGDVAHRAAPEVSAQISILLSETGLTQPSSVSEWAEVLELVGRLEAIERELEPQSWDLDLEQISTNLEPARVGWWSRAVAHLSNSEYRSAKKTLNAVSRSKCSGKHAAALLSEAIYIRDSWLHLGGNLPPKLPSNLAAANTSHRHLADQLAAFGAYASSAMTDQSPSALREIFGSLEADAANLRQLPFVHRLEERLRSVGLGTLLEALSQQPVDTPEIVGAFDLAWLQSIRTGVLNKESVLGSFNSRLHDQRVGEYADADREHLATAQQRVARSVAESATNVANQKPDQQQLIRAEARKKTRHRPLRQLIDTAPELLTALRPCWVMSPLVVSQMLPARQLFDVVIFDEASQVLPADAVPALARAPQVVIAGDRHQLPPTAFFASRIDGTNTDEDEQIDTALTQGYESVLDVTSSLLPEYMLTWHYRSEDEKLIAFSNYEIYGGGLTTFPGSGLRGVLNVERVPFDSRQSINTRSNPPEVERVVELMLDHARQRPTETLGVIAMGIEHANRIDALLEQRIREEADPELEQFFGGDHEERPFVKNLERVQGDERDAILISVGYGKDANGRLAMRFGPINQEGGHRRLNVAVTRARRRVTVISSFGADEVDLTKSGARGVEILKNYLKYVDSGGSDLSGARVDIALNPFELSVRDRLEAEGLSLIPQYGASGFRIDFAVRHPKDAGRMVMAIEADGASYHSTPTARDRDRLRQQMLERLGWRFHRIWSTSWFSDREREVQRVVAAYMKAVEVNGAPEPRQRGRHLADPSPEPAPLREGRPNVRPGYAIDDYSDAQLVAMVRWIQSDTLLRTHEDVLAEVIEELGFRRRGSKIVMRIERAIQMAGG